MTVTLPAFTPMQETLFLTLCGRALDNRSPHPILADTMADEIVRKLDYDCARFRLSASPIINIAHRAKKLDEVALRFITRHPDAVALDLGVGLVKLVKEILLTREPEVAEFPLALRLVTRLAAHSAAWSRRGTTVLHYRF